MLQKTSTGAAPRPGTEERGPGSTLGSSSMTRTTLGRLGFLLLTSVSCNSALLGGDNPASCPEGQVCPDPNNPGGQTSPEMVTKVGGNGSGGTPFNPMGG